MLIKAQRSIRRNSRGQGPLIFASIIIWIVGLALIVYGVGIVGLHLGDGLIAIGAGLLLLDVGGFVSFHNPAILVYGTPGAVIILIGAVLAALGH